jgi:predicted NBD/HSP70 family sugar kinase/DNA-binding XRE family transcriptional regulator
MIVAGDQQLLKQINRMALVRQLASVPGMSRAALAETVGLTKSTISLLVRELMDEGWLTESALRTTGALGRRATPLHIDGSRLTLLGADLGISAARIVATNLLGEVLAEQELPYADASDAGDCIARMAAGLTALTASEALAGRTVLGLGIGLHGVVDDATGVLQHAPHQGWRNIDVVNGRLLTGLYGFAGEVGHTILQQGGPLCSCGRRGCADALIGLQALMDEVYGKHQLSTPQLLEQLYAQADAGDAHAVRAVEVAGRNLGVLLNNLWVAFDPMCIVIGGAALRLGERLIAPGRQVLDDCASASQLTAPTVRTPRFGNNAIALGGAAMARHYLMRPFDSQGPARRHGGKLGELPLALAASLHAWN